MKKSIVFLICFFLFLGSTQASTIDELAIGTQISSEEIKDVSSYFKSYEINENDDIYQRIYGNSFPTDGKVQLDSLRYLKMIYYNYQNEIEVGEMIVHANLASDTLTAFQRIFEEQIEISSMRLIDDFYPANHDGKQADKLSMEQNNTSAFNYRVMTDSSSLSNHALGMAIDINPLENPYVSSTSIEPSTTLEEYTNATQRQNSTNPHVIKKNDKIYQIFTELGFQWGGDWQNPKDYQHFEKKVSEQVTSKPTSTNKNAKTILLIAGHGAGMACNHASGVYNGVRYYEVIETRKAVERIAKYLEQNGVKYEIANEVVGDAYWSNDLSLRNQARSCTNPSQDSSCCGYRTASVGTYEPVLMQHVDQVGRENYSLVFEIHFNSGPGATYTTTMLDKEQYTIQQKENSLKLSQAVVDAIGYGKVEFHLENDSSYQSLRTITQFYTNRSIPTYYMEAVFMDTPAHFNAYMEHADEAAKKIADVLTEIAPESVGSSSTLTNYQNNGRTIDPYPNIFGKVNIESYEDYGCNTFFFDNQGNPTDFKNFLDDIFALIQVVIPAVIIILSTIDYIKAIAGKDQDLMKKTSQKNIKRVIIGLIIFFLPYLLDLLFHVFGLYDISSCGIGG